MNRRRLMTGAVAAWAIAKPAVLRAQGAWPNQPIRLVTASVASGNAYIVAQIIAAELEKRLGQRIILEAVPQNSGMRATEMISTAAPDGYSLLVGTSSQLVFNMATFDPMPVDLNKTLRGVAMMNAVPLILCVKADAPAKSMAEYVAYLKANPKKVQYGSGPLETTTHVAGPLWARAAGVELEHVPYNAGSDAMKDVIAGRLGHVFDVAVTAPQIKAGAVRALAITSANRSAAAPDIPTAAEQGLAGFEAQTWNSIAAPAGLPQAIVDRLNAEVSATIASAEVRKKLEELASTFYPTWSPAEVDAFYAAERTKWFRSSVRPSARADARAL